MPYPYGERSQLIRTVLRFIAADSYLEDDSQYVDAEREYAEEQLEDAAMAFVRAVAEYKRRQLAVPEEQRSAADLVRLTDLTDPTSVPHD